MELMTYGDVIQKRFAQKYKRNVEKELEMKKSKKDLEILHLEDDDDHNVYGNAHRGHHHRKSSIRIKPTS